MNLSIHLFSAWNRNWIIERCLRHAGTCPETNRKCSEKRSGPKKEMNLPTINFQVQFFSFRYVFGTACYQLQLSLFFEFMKKQSVHSVCEPRSSEITSHIPLFTSTSFGPKPTTKNPHRQKHLRKNPLHALVANRWYNERPSWTKGGDSGR